jgi:hypothetical protein
MADPIPTLAFQNDKDDDEDSWLDEMIPFLLLAFAGGSPAFSSVESSIRSSAPHPLQNSASIGRYTATLRFLAAYAG